jgi:hypothetical protein
MPGTVHWRLLVVAKDERKAAKVAHRVGLLLAERLAVETIEPYWKIKGRWEVTATLELRATSFADAVVETLRLGSTVAHNWSVNCPEEAPDGSWHFDGYALGGFRVAGVALAHWTLAPLQT